MKFFNSNFLVNVFLFASFFSFYYIFSLHVIPQVFAASISLPLQALFSFTIIIALLMISHSLIKASEKERIIIPCLSISISLLGLFTIPLFAVKLACVLVIGVAFAVGQLSAYTYFWRTTKAEERGRVGGLISFIGLPIYFVASNLLAANFGLIEKITLCLFLCGLAVVSISFTKPLILQENKNKGGYYPEKRTILLYSIPWIIFTFVNATFAKNISEITSTLILPSLYNQLILIQTFAALIGALSGGFIADYFGRRLTLVLSVTLYGVSMTLHGITSSEVLNFFGFAAEGLSWGIILTLFVFVIWGDLANKVNCSRIFAVGLSIFYFFTGIGISNFFVIDSLTTNTLISCLLIFLSNIPIVLAPELLPSDTKEKMRLKKYMKNVKQIVKDTEKK